MVRTGKGFFIVDVVRLGVFFGNKPCFESIDQAVGVMFDFVNPSTANCFLVWCARDEIPCIVLA